MSQIYGSLGFFIAIMVIFSLMAMSRAEETCERNSPIRERPGFYFRDHTIQNLTAYGEGVCRIKCFLVTLCKSYNYYASTQRCELNDADESDHPADLVKRDGFVFVGLQECTSSLITKCHSCVCDQVDCSGGTYYDRDTKLCVPCKKGSYQDKEGQQFCKTCPNDTDTLTIGAKSVKDCEECGMDFERGIDNWTKTGTAFNNQPTYGDNSRHRGKGSAQHQGNWWIGGYEDRPKSSMPPGAVQGDGPQGTLTSPLFLVTGKDISFLIGGACDIDLARVELLIDGEVVRKETGSKCSESMVRRHWDVTEYKGMNAQVRLVDHSSRGWGHINFDDLRGDTCIMFQKHKTTSVK